MAEGRNKTVKRGGLCINMKKALNKEGRGLDEEEKWSQKAEAWL